MFSKGIYIFYSFGALSKWKTGKNKTMTPFQRLALTLHSISVFRKTAHILNMSASRVLTV